MMPAIEKAAGIRLMGFDVDGVMTDGRLYFGPDGDFCKAFFSRDGLGIKLLAKSGVRIAIITGRDSPIVTRRAANLGIQLVRQGAEDKRTAMAEILASENLDFTQCGYMGDDLIDLPLLRACGFAACVPDAHALVRQHADHVARAPAGAGAVREVCEMPLRAQGNWERVMAPYLAD
jgi:3-deoxy-D-manno-octulosonate 8-phosphate phosphatase (KDO 8-P phosphatase)